MLTKIKIKNKIKNFLYSGMDAHQAVKKKKVSYTPLYPGIDVDLVYLANFLSPSVKQKKYTLIS